MSPVPRGSGPRPGNLPFEDLPRCGLSSTEQVTAQLDPPRPSYPNPRQRHALQSAVHNLRLRTRLRIIDTRSVAAPRAVARQLHPSLTGAPLRDASQNLRRPRHRGQVPGAALHRPGARGGPVSGSSSSQRDDQMTNTSTVPRGKTSDRSGEVASLLAAARAVLENRAFADAARAVLRCVQDDPRRRCRPRRRARSGSKGPRDRRPRSGRPRARPNRGHACSRSAT